MLMVLAISVVAQLQPATREARFEGALTQVTPLPSARSASVIREDLVQLNRKQPSMAAPIALIVVGSALSLVGLPLSIVGVVLVASGNLGGLIIGFFALGGGLVFAIPGVICLVVGLTLLASRQTTMQELDERRRELQDELQRATEQESMPPPLHNVRAGPWSSMTLARF